MTINTKYPILKSSDGLNVYAILNNISDNNIQISRNLLGKWECNFVVHEKKNKTNYIANDNIVEVEGQSYRIIYYEEDNTDDGSHVYSVKCEHISYDLNNQEYIIDSFSQNGTPREILETLLAGSDFTVDAIDFTDSILFTINEQVTIRRAIFLLAEFLNGEVDYNNKTVNIISQIGSDTGFQFRSRKNLQGIKVIRDKRTGEEVVSYQINFVELKDSEEYKRLKYASLQSFRLGDNVKVINDRTNTNINTRIVEYTYNPIKAENSQITLSNAIQNSTNDTTKIKFNSIFKNQVYNGIKIGPEIGIEQTLSDKTARSIFDSQQLKMQVGDGNGNYTDAVYFEPLDGKYKFNGDLEAVSGTFSGSLLAASGSFSGNISASSIVSSIINNGNGTFEVDPNGNVTAASIEITGGSIDIGANFSVDSNGNMNANNGDFTGNITGSIITGSTINVDTDVTIGNDLYLGDEYEAGVSKNVYFASLARIRNYPINGQGSGDVWTGLELYASEIKVPDTIIPINSESLFLGDFSFWGNVDFTAANVTGLGSSSVDWSDINSNPFYGYSPSDFEYTAGDAIDIVSGEISVDINEMSRSWYQDQYITTPYYQGSSTYTHVDSDSTAGTVVFRDVNGNVIGVIDFSAGTIS
ncbi:MAG: hypothetical protein FH761_16580 [Firmicutes bacterium]|nr:hypothetical protein [Bacillota bacterium]